MVTIEFNKKKYTFKDEYTGRDFISLPDNADKKIMQFNLIAHMSIEPKLTVEQSLDLPMSDIAKLMQIYFPSGEE